MIKSCHKPVSRVGLLRLTYSWCYLILAQKLNLFIGMIVVQLLFAIGVTITTLKTKNISPICNWCRAFLQNSDCPSVTFRASILGARV